MVFHEYISKKYSGQWLFYTFICYQITTITTFFLAVTQIFITQISFWQRCVFCIVFILCGIFSISILYILISTSENSFGKFQSLKKLLENLIIQKEDMERIQVEKIKFLIKDVENIRPLSGNGYFDLSKGTLTSIVSISITYFIILLQFRSPSN